MVCEEMIIVGVGPTLVASTPSSLIIGDEEATELRMVFSEPVTNVATTAITAGEATLGTKVVDGAGVLRVYYMYSCRVKTVYSTLIRCMCVILYTFANAIMTTDTRQRLG